VSTENEQPTSGGDSVTNLIEGLSRRAEAALSQRAGPSPEAFAALSLEAAQQLLHDLQVHQIELEMQNEELRRTHTALEASRSHYFNFYDLAPVGYCTVTEKGLIREVNLTTCALLNVTRSQLIKQPIGKFIFNDDQGIYYGLRHRLGASGGSLSCELRLLQREDTPFWAHLVVSAVQDDDGVSELRIVLSDITERKRLEQELHDANVELARQSESRYRSLIKWTPEPLVVHDGKKIIFANPATVKMLAAASDKELVGKAILDLVHPDSRDLVRERLRAGVEQGVKVPLIEEKCLKLDGTPIDVEVQSRPIDFGGKSATLISIRDITERKLAERRIQKQSEQLRLLYEASQRLSSTLELNEIYQVVDDFMSTIAPGCDFLVSAFDPDTQLITCRSFVMNGKALDVSAFPPIPLEEEGRGTQSLVIRSGKSLLLNDYQATLKTARTSYFVNDQTHELDEQVDPEEEVAQSALIVPLKVGDRVTGVVQVMSYRPNAFSEEQLHVLESLALHIASAEQNAQLYARVQYELEQRKQADARLLETMAEIRLREQALSQISQGVLISGADRLGLTTYVNDEFVRITGYAREEVLGKPCSILQGPGSRPDVVLQIRAALDAKQPFHGEILNYRKDGTPFWNDLSINPVFDEAGNVTQFVGIQRDVTQRKLAEESLRIAAVAFESQQAMFITNPQQVILRINKGFSGITGYTAEEAVGQTPRLLSSGKHGADFYAAMWECVSRSGQWHGEIWNRRKNGTVYPQQLNISTVKDPQGLLTHYVGTFSDITSTKAAEEQIESLAFTDLLTGLPNRRRLIIQLQQAMIAREREKHQCALLMVDLDNFKNLNDAIGHAQGDEVLQRVAKRLSAATRDGDTVARLGGDEFVVLLDHLNQDPQLALRQAQTVANKMLEALNKPYQLAGSTISCTASIGITFFGEQYEDTLEPLKRAELALYQAKSGGRNMLRFFDPQMQAVVDARVKLEAALQEAIQNQQFTLYYQAQVSDSEGIVGVEALVRWFDPKRGMVSPAEFIPLAEETGLILPIGAWVLETACQQLAAWADQPAMAHLSIAVNVSARQFRESNFVSQTLATLQRTRANPQRLKLELTESVLIADAEDVIVKMNALKAIGIGFAIDDFGTGYSSLSYLKRLPLERLKIDQGFVRNILMDPDDAAISRAVIAMATSMGLGVIAEGVETEAQRDFLASLGCHNYQGYLFSRPLPIQEFEAFATRF